MRNKLILLCIVIISFALRLYRLESKAIWYDELDSIASSTREVPIFQDKEVVYKPLFFVLFKVWILLFGTSVFWLRMFSVFFGTASVWLLYLLGKEMFGEKTGLLASFFLSISPFHIYYSQEARYFAFMVFLSIASYYAFILFLKEGRTKFLVFNAALNLLLSATYPFGIFVLGAQALAVLPHKGRLRNVWLMLTCAVLLLFAVPVFSASFYIMKGMTWWIQKPGIATLKDMFTTFVTGGENYGRGPSSMLSGPYDAFRILRITDMAALFAIIPFFAWGVFALFRDKADKVLLVAAFFLTVTATYTVSRAGVVIFAIKHLIVILPVFILVLSYGILSARKPLRYPSIALISVLVILPLYAMYNFSRNIDWKYASEAVKEFGKRGDAVMLATDKEALSFLYHFRGASNDVLSDMGYWGKLERRGYRDVFEEKGFLLALVKENRGQAEQELRADFLKKTGLLADERRARVWLLASKWVTPEDISFMKDRLMEQGFKPVMERNKAGVDTVLFSR